MTSIGAARGAALCAACMAAGGAAAQAAIEAAIEADFTGRTVAPDARLALRIDAATQAVARELRIFVGRTDVSALLRSPAPGVLEVGAALPWPAGATELVVYRVGSPAWQTLARLPLVVAGQDTAGDAAAPDEFAPRAELQIKGRARERGDAGAAARGAHADAVGQGGLAWKTARSGWRFEAQANLSGASHRPETLRFAELAARAPKLDLADYRIDAAHGEHRVELGHLSVGNHPLLLAGMASRGLTLRSRLGARTDLSLSAVNGTAIVGVDNLLGIEQADHRVHAMTLGVEMLAQRPGGLRAELTLLDASLRARANFERGEIPDAERSRGVGARLLASSADGRLRADIALARSRFVNPFDPLLAQGGELQPVQPALRDAHSAELQFDVLKQSPLLSAAHALDLSVSARHERADPHYKSLGATLDSDRVRRRIGLQAAMAGAQLQLQAARSVDNLAQIPTLLRTRTDERIAALNLPLPAWLGDAATLSRWPSLAWSWQSVRQRAVNAPPTELSGFAATHLPDQANATQQLNLAWAFDAGTLAYTLARSRQDNRQPGRERADFSTLGHQLAWAWTFGEAWRADLGLTRSRQHSVEQSLTRRTLGGTASIDWQADERWSFAAHLDATHGDDSQRLAASRSIGAHLQASRRLALPAGGRSLPGQAFLRLARQGDRQSDAVFGQASEQRLWWVDFGLSFSLF